MESELYHGLNVTHWAFNIMQGKMWQIILCHLQTIEMSVLALIMDTRLVPLIRIGDCGSPNIGFGSTMGLSFHFVFWLFGLGSAQWMKSTSRLMKVWLRCVHNIVVCLFVFFGYHTSHPSNILWFQVTE